MSKTSSQSPKDFTHDDISAVILYKMSWLLYETVTISCQIAYIMSL